MAQPSPTGRPRHDVRTDDQPGVDLDTEATLDLLEDGYAQAVLEALREEPRSARALDDALEASRATVYRRLDALEEAGLVEGRLSYDPQGNHRQVFSVTVAQVTVEIGTDGLALEATPAEDAGTDEGDLVIGRVATDD